MTHVELNKTYVGGDDDNSIKRFQEMCLLVSANFEQYSGIWYGLNKSNLLGTDNYPNNPTAAYDLL